MPTPPKPSAATPSARGYTLSELAARERISYRTAQRWVEKGAVKVSRVAPRTGVRVQYPDLDDDDDL